MKNNLPNEYSNKNKETQTKDQIQKAAMSDQNKPKCRVCGKYTDKKTSPQCFGHASGGGSNSSDNDSGAKLESKSTSGSAKPTTSRLVESSTSNKKTNNNYASASSLTSLKNVLKFDDGIVSDLLLKRVLTIINDPEKGLLSIKLQYNPASLSKEQRNELEKYIRSIVSELDQFIKKHSITGDHHTLIQDKNGHLLSLQISLPTPRLYDAFIAYLASLNLLPQQSIRPDQVVSDKERYSFYPTPLSTKPTPNQKKSTENEEQELDVKSHIKPKSPIDGIKPTGWK